MAVDVRSVGAFQVDNDELAFLVNNLGVTLGDVAFGQDDVVALHASHCDLRLVELQPLGLTTLFLHDDGKHEFLSLIYSNLVDWNGVEAFCNSLRLTHAIIKGFRADVNLSDWDFQ